MKKALLVGIGFLILLSSLALADIGPKPTAYFEVTYDGRSLGPDQDFEFKAQMLVCQEHSQRPLENLIPSLRISEYDASRSCYWEPAEFAWGGECVHSECKFNYFLPDEFKLAVYLPSQDQVFVSDLVTKKNFEAFYQANLLPDRSITIKDITPFSQSSAWSKIKTFFFALILTLFFELLATLVFVLISKDSKKILFWVFLANLISLPLVWFVFPLLKNFGWVILLAEIFAFLFEAGFIHLFNKKTFSFRKSLLLSLVINLASFLIGGFIYMFVTQFLMIL